MEKDREILVPFSGWFCVRFLVEKTKKKKKSDLFSRFLFDKGKRDIRYPHRKISSADERA
jgi:hypothetical protein